MERPVNAGTMKEKIAIGVFTMFILMCVVLKYWASSRSYAVPFPNFLAVSEKHVAVQSGTSVYVYTKDGVLKDIVALGPDVIPTQVFWEKDILCVGDIRTQSVIYPNNREKRSLSFKKRLSDGPFKVVREPASGRLFVSVGDKHQILVYDNGGFLKSFGKMGDGPGQFKFPNDLFFDEKGRLMISNTRQSSIDAYSPDGVFMKKIVEPKGDKYYRFPTSFSVTPDRLFVLENDTFLEKGKIRTYSRDGEKKGELTSGSLEVVGALAADSDHLYATDCKNRRLVTWSFPSLSQTEPFSADFESRCVKWRDEARLYEILSQGSLILLVLFCLPVFWLYFKIRKKDEADLSRIDAKPFVGKGSDGTGIDIHIRMPVNTRMGIIGMVLIGISSFGPIIVMALTSNLMFLIPGIVKEYIWVVFVLSAMLITGLFLFVKSNMALHFFQKNADSVFKRLIRDNKLTLDAGEQIERVALFKRPMCLMLFTNRKMMICGIGLMGTNITGIEPIPYSDIRAVKLVANLIMIEIGIDMTFVHNGNERKVNFRHFSKAYCTVLADEMKRRTGLSSSI